MIKVIVMPANILPHLKLYFGYHPKLKCKHDDLLGTPKKMPVGGEEGVEVDPKDCPHMSDSPLVMGLEQIAHMGPNAASVVADHAIRKLLVGAENVGWYSCKSVLPT